MAQITASGSLMRCACRWGGWLGVGNDPVYSKIGLIGAHSMLGLLLNAAEWDGWIEWRHETSIVIIVARVWLHGRHVDDDGRLLLGLQR